MTFICQMMVYTPLIPALGRQRQVDLRIRGQPGLQSEFQSSQDYTEKPCLGRVGSGGEIGQKLMKVQETLP
ncbi:mCG147000, partial [Mus musculus]